MTILAELRTAGRQRFGELGVWVYDEWGRLNTAFFGGQNRPGAIYWTAAIRNESLGCYYFTQNVIYLNKDLVRPIYPVPMAKWCLQHLNQRLASDVLLHEMIHQKIHQTGGWEGATSHNNERFVDEVNRLAKLLDLDVKAQIISTRKSQNNSKQNNKPGYLTSGELVHFPYFTRPSDYYRQF